MLASVLLMGPLILSARFHLSIGVYVFGMLSLTLCRKGATLCSVRWSAPLTVLVLGINLGLADIFL
jgi:hypothetical protein